MTYGYFPTPARSEPATVLTRSLSSSFDDDRRVPRPLRPTRSVPASFPSTKHQSPRDMLSIVGLGLGLGLPSTFMTRLHPRPERPRLQRQNDLGLGTPFTAVPIRSMRRRVAGAHPLPTASRSRSIGQPTPEHTHHTHTREDDSHPTITLTLADAFDSEGEDDFLGHGTAEDDEQPRYNFLPPGLSSPVPWPSSPASGPTSPTSPFAQPMTFRMLTSPGIRGPGNVTPPGAPLSPSVSRFGTHRHFPGLDHSAGGVADDDALLRSPMDMPEVSRSRTRVPMVARPGAPRLSSVDRFGRESMY